MLGWVEAQFRKSWLQCGCTKHLKMGLPSFQFHVFLLCSSVHTLTPESVALILSPGASSRPSFPWVILLPCCYFSGHEKAVVCECVGKPGELVCVCFTYKGAEIMGCLVHYLLKIQGVYSNLRCPNHKSWKEITRYDVTPDGSTYIFEGVRLNNLTWTWLCL